MHYMLKVRLTTTTLLACNLLSWIATAQAFGAEAQSTSGTVEYENIRIPITMFVAAIGGTVVCTWFLARLYHSLEKKDMEMKVNLIKQIEERKHNEETLQNRIGVLEKQLNHREAEGSD